MNDEQVEIQKQIDGFKARVIFIDKWINDLKKKGDYESLDKAYNLKTEKHHKEFIIRMRENDQKMFKNQQDEAIKQMRAEFGPLVKTLRTSIMPDTKTAKMSDGISKRFGSKRSIQEEIKDFQMAKQLIELLKTDEKK